MGLLDSLFGGGKQKTKSSTNVAIPAQQQALFNNAAGLGQQIGTFLTNRQAGQQKAADSIYSRLAGEGSAFNVGQDRLQSMLGSTASTQDIQSRMNPYLDSVLASGRQDILDRAATDKAARAAQAVAARGYGGSRQAVGDALADQSVDKQLTSLEANTRASAFGQGLNQYNLEQQRDASLANQLGNLQTQEAAYNWGNLSNVNIPTQQNLQAAQGVASIGMAYPYSSSSTGTSKGGGPGLLQQGVGLAATGYGLGSAFGWFADGGEIPEDDDLTGMDVAYLDLPPGYDEQADRLWGRLVQRESGGNPNATSPKGARGIAQVMPETGREYAKKLGIDNYSDDMLYDSNVSQAIGKRYLRDMLDKYDGDERLALAAYNAGPGRVDSWVKTLGRGGDFVEKIPFKETRDYVKSFGLPEARSMPVSANSLGAGAPQGSAVDQIMSHYQRMGPTRDDIRDIEAEMAPRKVAKRGLFDDGPAGNPWLTLGASLLSSRGNFGQALGESINALSSLGRANRAADVQDEMARRMTAKAKLENATKLAVEDARGRRQAVVEGVKLDAARGKTPDALATFAGKLRLAGIDPQSPEGQAQIRKMMEQGKGTSEFERLSSRLAGMSESDPEYANVKARVDSLTKGLPEAFERKEEIEATDRYYKDILKGGESGRSAVGRLNMALDLVKQNKDAIGKLAPMRELIGGYAAELGLDNQKVRTAANLEQLNGILTQGVNEGLRDNAGVQTEGDAQRTREEYGSVKNQPEALEFLIRLKKSGAAANVRRQEFFDRYREESGRRSGSDAAWSKYLKTHPQTAKSADDGKVIFYNEFADQLPEGTDPKLADYAWEAIAKGRSPKAVLEQLSKMGTAQ